MTISLICFSFCSLEAMDSSIHRTRSFVHSFVRSAEFGCSLVVFLSFVALTIIASDSGLVEKEQSRKTRQRLSKRHQVVKESRGRGDNRAQKKK